MSEKSEFKNFKFLPLSSKSHFQTNICWPVFSLVDRFVLNLHNAWPRHCFWVTCFVHENIDSPYVFEFWVTSMSREVPMGMFSERINSRCFHCFPAAMLESLRIEGLQHGVSTLNTLIFCDTFCRITRVQNIAHPRKFGTLFIYYSSTIFQFLDSIYLMVSDFIFHLRDN